MCHGERRTLAEGVCERGTEEDIRSGSNTGVVKCSWSKLHNEELNAAHYSPDIY
jgi:hypothetical protein